MYAFIRKCCPIISYRKTLSFHSRFVNKRYLASTSFNLIYKCITFPGIISTNHLFQRHYGSDWGGKSVPGVVELFTLLTTQEQNRIRMAEKGTHRFVKCGAYKGKGLAMFTSGGDSPGMNAAIRAIVRMGTYLGCKVYFIKEGYQGMVDGGNHIMEANWSSVSSIIHKGGTVIGSARCKAFMTREGLLKAAKNLVDKDITNLAVIGGDGTLTGANEFRLAWKGLLDELLSKKLITKDQLKKCSFLNICGLVGSIDNDFCGTDMTIGTDSAVHRIIEAIDAIAYTAYSHQRTFIMEVMGRHCGYLGLVTALAGEADYVFVPEEPAPVDWHQALCSKLSQERAAGQRLNIIIVAEGAIDRNGQRISAEQIKKVVVENLHQDTRITVLGHVQRGGSPTAFDRVLGCRMGAEAVMALVEATETSEPIVIGLAGNQAVRLPLMECVKRTKAVAKAVKDKDWKLAVELRGKSFGRNLETYKMLTQLKATQTDKAGYTFGVVHIGAPACGMNAAVRSFVRNAIYTGHKVLGIQDGVQGLIAGRIKQLTWPDVTGWVAQGGAILGTKRTLPGTRIAAIAQRLKEFNIQALLIIGGFEGFQAALHFYESREKLPAFKIPIIVIPSTISNNIPGTQFSLGCDTALNEITEICDRIRQSAQGTKRRVFIIETMGGYCGYLATLAGLAGGADAVYIHEEKFTIKDLQQDVYYMGTKMAEGVQRGLIVRNENASKNYDTDFIYKLYSEEGKGLFSTRMNVLGHMQQGSSPSSFDRNMATKMGAKAARWMADQVKKSIKSDGTMDAHGSESAVLLGVVRRRYIFNPLSELKEQANFELRLPKQQWWLSLRPLLKILAKHNSAYGEEGLYMKIEESSKKG